MSHPKSNRAAAGRGRDDKPRRLCYDPAKPIWGASKMRKTLRNLVAALLVLAAPAVMPGSAFAHAVVVKATGTAVTWPVTSLGVTVTVAVGAVRRHRL